MITLEKQLVELMKELYTIQVTGRNANSHLLNHSIESGHKPLEAIDYKIIGTGYHKNTMKMKLSKALFVKELKPTLIKQEKSVPLKLFK